MAAPQAATESVLTAWAHCLQPTILEHNKCGQAAQLSALRLTLVAQATAEGEAENGRKARGCP